MNKIYQRIDWENYPSSATPLNEDNLNKMDYAIDKLDDRIVTHETTKLNTATGNTLVKNVTFNEKTGVFTIEKLNGSKITINTALEKISTNFHFNPTTQKLVLTLIDGTVQEIDLSALITQYEFLESDTITFEIDASGKVKANILNGSITGEKLEPNYLANVTLQANNAKTSADNAKTSEELAYQYAEEAKESASQTAKSDAKNITYDNTESGLSATNVKDALDEVAQGSVSAIATDTTIQDSTNAPLIYGKFKGYTIQNGEPTPDNPVEINGLAKDGAIEVKTIGKNIFGGLALAQALVDSGSTNVVLDENAKTIQYGRKTNGSYTIFDKFKENTQYTIMLNGNHSNNSNATYATNLSVSYTDGTAKGIDLNNTGEFNHLFVTQVNKSVSSIYYGNGDIDTTTLNYEQCGIFEGVITAEEFEPYTETTAAIPTDVPLYEGDYLEVYADGSGKVVRKMGSVVFDGDEQISISTMLSNDNRLAVYYNPIDAKLSINGVNSISNQLKRISCTEAHNDETKTGFFVGDTRYNPNHSFIVLVFPSTTATDLSTLQTWLQSNPVTVVYELATPQEIELTAEQVAEFKKLYTFEPVTNVLCDGEVEIQYYKNTPSGVAVGTVHRMANDEKATYDGDGNVITETYTKKTSILSTFAQCLVSSLDTDIVGAKVMKDISNALNGKMNYIVLDNKNIDTVFSNHIAFGIIDGFLYITISYSWIALQFKIKGVSQHYRVYYGDNGWFDWNEFSIKVDDVLSETSTNPVQNKVITEALMKHNHKQKKIIVVTDSYGVPVREDSGTYGSWVDMLAEKYDVLKIASGGAGFVSYFNNTFLNNLRGTTIADKDAYTDIIVAGGVNDAGDSTKPITTEDISNGIIEFCDYCKENFPNAKIHIACVGGITPRSNIKERCLNLHNVVFQAYSNTNADYDYCTFSESIFYDRSLLINVHPTEEGHIETFKYFNRMLNGQCSFVRNFNSIVKINNTNIGFHGTISNGIAHYTGQRTQITFGELEIGPAYNFATGVEVGVISDNSVLAVPSRPGYAPYVIMGSLFVARTKPSSLAYAGVGFLYPNEDGTKLLLQITSPDLVGSANDKIKANFYFIPTPTVIAQTTA